MNRISILLLLLFPFGGYSAEVKTRLYTVEVVTLAKDTINLKKKKKLKSLNNISSAFFISGLLFLITGVLAVFTFFEIIGLWLILVPIGAAFLLISTLIDYYILYNSSLKKRKGIFAIFRMSLYNFWYIYFWILILLGSFFGGLFRHFIN
ncbi:MAG: hypothetical protein ACRCVT_06845 [Leadbetterella sp.]